MIPLWRLFGFLASSLPGANINTAQKLQPHPARRSRPHCDWPRRDGCPRPARQRASQPWRGHPDCCPSVSSLQSSGLVFGYRHCKQLTQSYNGFDVNMVARSFIHVEHVKVPAAQAFDPSSLDYFEKSLQECKARGVRVGAVVSTLSSVAGGGILMRSSSVRPRTPSDAHTTRRRSLHTRP